MTLFCTLVAEENIALGLSVVTTFHELLFYEVLDMLHLAERLIGVEHVAYRFDDCLQLSILDRLSCRDKAFSYGIGYLLTVIVLV